MFGATEGLPLFKSLSYQTGDCPDARILIMEIQQPANASKDRLETQAPRAWRGIRA